MILSLAILLLAGQVESDCVRVPRAGGCVRANGRSGAGFAFFEAFPASGAGTSGVCSTTAPTGAKGETLTFTRGSNGTCTKTATGGLATTGIADGDLVVLSSNQPRVEYDSQGVLGLLVESSRTNSVVRSQELDNGAWIPASGGGGSAPTITANYATAPDGTMTADRLQTSACVANPSFSVAYQSYTGTAAAWATTVYIRGTSGSGTLALYSYDTTAATGTWTSCAYDASSWTRCTLQRTWANTTHQIGFGCTYDSVVYSGSSNTGANDVLVWGMSSEAGAYATSYIPTTSAAVTRSAESPYFTVSVPSPTYSIAASFETPYSVGSSSARVATLFQDGSHYTDDYFPTRFTAFLFDGATDSKLSSATVTTSGRVGSYFDGTNLAACVGGSCETVAAAATWTAWTRVRIGVDGVGGTAGHINGLVGRICLDPNPTRCR